MNLKRKKRVSTCACSRSTFEKKGVSVLQNVVSRKKKAAKGSGIQRKKTDSGILKSDVKEDGSSKGIDYSHPC